MLGPAVDDLDALKGLIEDDGREEKEEEKREREKVKEERKRKEKKRKREGEKGRKRKKKERRKRGKRKKEKEEKKKKEKKKKGKKGGKGKKKGEGEGGREEKKEKEEEKGGGKEVASVGDDTTVEGARRGENRLLVWAAVSRKDSSLVRERGDNAPSDEIELAAELGNDAMNKKRKGRREKRI